MATAGADGTFSITGLREGSYTVEAFASSFSTSPRAGVKLAAGATENVNLALDISDLAQSITVEGTVSLAAETAPSQIPWMQIRRDPRSVRSISRTSLRR
jgi:hypothetical protein